MDGCHYGDHAVNFAGWLRDRGDLIGLETYLYEVPRRYLRSYLDVNIRGNLDNWARLVPGIQDSLLEVLGYFTVPSAGNWASHARSDFKVFVDIAMKLMANHPTFWNLKGVSAYASRKADEEYVRWLGRLYRHYCIEGNTDPRGTNEYNMALGERRALSAKKYLVNLGISDSRLSTISFGEERLLMHGHDELSWAQNRRADFVIVE